MRDDSDYSGSEDDDGMQGAVAGETGRRNSEGIRCEECTGSDGPVMAATEAAAHKVATGRVKARRVATDEAAAAYRTVTAKRSANKAPTDKATAQQVATRKAATP